MSFNEHLGDTGLTDLDLRLFCLSGLSRKSHNLNRDARRRLLRKLLFPRSPRRFRVGVGNIVFSILDTAKELDCHESSLKKEKKFQAVWCRLFFRIPGFRDRFARCGTTLNIIE